METRVGENKGRNFMVIYAKTISSFFYSWVRAKSVYLEKEWKSAD